MNERIQELAEQAEHNTRKEHNNAYWRLQNEIAEDETFLKKFAELIVRECGQVLVDKTPVVNFVEGEDWDKGYDRAMNDCIHHIYEHFGIEE